MLDRQEGSSLLEDVVIVGGLLLAQCVLAAYVVFIDHLLGLGAHPLAVIVVAGVASAAFFLPFAIALERHEPVACHRTAAISSKPAMPPYMGLLLLHFTFLILNTCVPRTDAVGDREDDAGSRLRSAMPNLSPGLIFIVAACFRFDKACKYTQAKLVGTLVCLVGVMAMSFLHSPSSSSYPEAAGGGSSYDWILGCSYLVGAAVVLSLVTVLQDDRSGRDGGQLPGAAFTAVLQVILTWRGGWTWGRPRSMPSSSRASSSWAGPASCSRRGAWARRGLCSCPCSGPCRPCARQSCRRLSWGR
ncbi:hypothetical protein GQ55_4G367400 [Panicum hallii var. hallii]|uniref:WAT1-related protein n=1 Tax=Panicum hallii var. hallii TaxID=1504633 RepID=A0A2T7E3Y1_9POAL|nr:hypothetical protein GQ55_4G367400 [Panicum hallii var. hallii]